jgi:hypothetical protein
MAYRDYGCQDLNGKDMKKRIYPEVYQEPDEDREWLEGIYGSQPSLCCDPEWIKWIELKGKEYDTQAQTR